MGSKPERAQRKPGDVDPEFAPMSDDLALRRRVERQINKQNEFRLSLGAYIVGTLGLSVLFIGLGVAWIAGVVALGWGAGVAVHGIDTYYQTGPRAARRLARMHQAFRDAYGPDWYDTASVRQLDKIRRRVDEPINKRKEFFMHLAVFLCIIPMLWLIYGALTPDLPIPWPLLATLGWGAALLLHGLYSLPSIRQSDVVEREMDRQRSLIAEAGGDIEKPKRSRPDEPLALDEDGELTDDMLEIIERERHSSSRRSR